MILEREFTLDCPLFMYEDTTPTIVSQSDREDADWLKTESFLYLDQPLSLQLYSHPLPYLTDKEKSYTQHTKKNSVTARSKQ